MTKSKIISFSSIAALFLTFAVPSASAQSSYAEDRAMIENVVARYVFALDFQDAETAASTFAKDADFDTKSGVTKGREAIRSLFIQSAEKSKERRTKDTSGLRPAAARHFITNMVIKGEGNKAQVLTYWLHMNNDNPQRTASTDAFGHTEDEMVKVDGKWYFSKRKIFNEETEERSAKGSNPAW
jgi:uncharacterized protein (TIGR02246 family)